ncbi:hypothetical protein B0H17DRAFT_1201656 [Mycena rosella]|uniref:Uncharacterized protein n=1 Tax=Mycena rosella TaxID=1033263 RepID=A0AAD7DG72_MYCRO|nr:hypothetical protein B0H17DRAFT_1201656 [Mycena rosella]
MLHPNELQKVQDITKAFTPRSDAINKLLGALSDADDAVALLQTLGDTPELPQEANNSMARKINAIIRLYEALDTHGLCMTVASSAPVDTEHIYGEDCSDSSDDGSEPAEDDLDFEDLQIFHPTDEVDEDGDEDGRLIRIISFLKYNKAAFHARLFLRRSTTHLDLSAYDLPEAFTHAHLYVYSVLTKQYELLLGPLNLEGRGRIVIFRNVGVHECPRSIQWERWALWSAEEDAAEAAEAVIAEAWEDAAADPATYNLPPSSEPTYPSSQTPADGVYPTNPVTPVKTTAAPSHKVAGKRKM